MTVYTNATIHALDDSQTDASVLIMNGTQIDFVGNEIPDQYRNEDVIDLKCDVGSLSAKVVILNDNEIVSSGVVRCGTDPDKSAKNALEVALADAGLTASRKKGSKIRETTSFVHVGICNYCVSAN